MVLPWTTGARKAGSRTSPPRLSGQASTAVTTCCGLRGCAARGTRPGSSVIWTPLGPVPLACDARATARRTITRSQGGPLRLQLIPPIRPETPCTSAARKAECGSPPTPRTPLPQRDLDSYLRRSATLSIGAIAIQPGNTNPAQSLILAATGEADNSADPTSVSEFCVPPTREVPGL